jgi:hypothetical protein
MEKSNAIYWSIVWFFALKEEEQEMLFGQTEEQWFIEENTKNIGANYLKGVCIAFDEFAGYRFVESILAEELKSVVRTISENYKPAYWNFDILKKTNEWKLARKKAKMLLEEEKIWIQPPSRPFVIEQLIRVEHYCHAREVRKHLKK